MSKNIQEFLIEFNGDDSSYFSGGTVAGKIILTVIRPILVEQLSAMIVGKTEIKIRGQNQSIDHENVLVKNEWADILKPGKMLVEGTHYFNFSKSLPSKIPGSIEGKFGHIRYMVKGLLVFVGEDQSTETYYARRGFTVIERNELNYLPVKFREPISRNASKKFGLFSCTGGHVKFIVSLGRSAYVAGENIPISGRLENKTDRRVDKANATLVMVTSYLNDLGEVGKIDTFDVNDEALALFVDPDANIRIERNFALPALIPTTPFDPEQQIELSQTGRRMSQAPIKHQQNSSSSSKHQPFKRTIRVDYELRLRVEIGDGNKFDTTVALVVGTAPYQMGKRKTLAPDAATHSADQQISSPLYRQPRSEKAVNLSKTGESYVCEKYALMLTNRYPFFAELPTSSKQSKKISTIVHLLRAERELRKALVSPQRTESIGNDIMMTSSPAMVTTSAKEENKPVLRKLSFKRRSSSVDISSNSSTRKEGRANLFEAVCKSPFAVPDP